MIAPFWPSRSALGASRVLRPSDGAACAVLHATSFAHPWLAQEFEALALDPACSGDLVERNSEAAGFILSRRALDEAEILTIVVDPRFRGRGCGERLLACHMARLANLGVAALFLDVEQYNKPALALYRRFGFVEQGTRKAYYAKPDGTRANALVMRRLLA